MISAIYKKVHILKRDLLVTYLQQLAVMKPKKIYKYQKKSKNPKQLLIHKSAYEEIFRELHKSRKEVLYKGMGKKLTHCDKTSKIVKQLSIDYMQHK